MKYKKRIVSCIVALVILLIGYFSQKNQVKEKFGLENIPEFSYVEEKLSMEVQEPIVIE